MDIRLSKFNGDIQVKEAVLDFVRAFIDKKGLEKIYNGDDTKAIKEARELIEGAFEYLSELHDAKPTTTTEESSR